MDYAQVLDGDHLTDDFTISDGSSWVAIACSAKQTEATSFRDGDERVQEIEIEGAGYDSCRMMDQICERSSACLAANNHAHCN